MKYPMPNKRATGKGEWRVSHDVPDTTNPYWQQRLSTALFRGVSFIPARKVSFTIDFNADILM
jgi:hypothetical protein